MRFDDSYSNAFTLEDAIKPSGFRENIAIGNSGKLLSIEKRAMPVAAEVFQLYSNGYTKETYLFNIDLVGLSGKSLYLDDAYTGSSTQLEAGEAVYTFSVNNDPASK
ncbi:MAG: hypothetical protein H3C36_14735, partial [Chitinophagaceae bacterium]|nr:hypothetical protein [Chitinophagaceae bacterium]